MGWPTSVLGVLSPEHAPASKGAEERAACIPVRWPVDCRFCPGRTAHLQEVLVLVQTEPKRVCAGVRMLWCAPVVLVHCKMLTVLYCSDAETGMCGAIARVL